MHAAADIGSTVFQGLITIMNERNHIHFAWNHVAICKFKFLPAVLNKHSTGTLLALTARKTRANFVVSIYCNF